MRYSKLFAASVLFAGLVATGAQAQAGEIRRDEFRTVELRNHISADRARLNEALRHGHYREADAIRRDIARDQAALDAQLRDLHHDRRF